MLLRRLLAMGTALLVASLVLQISASAATGCTLTKKPGLNIIEGDGSNNVCNGTSIADAMYGYGGNDTFSGLDGPDQLNMHAGADTGYGNAGNDYLFGSGGNDRLLGGNGDDHINGGDGSDNLTDTGGTGDKDVLCASSSAEDSASDTMNVQDGDYNDIVYGSAGYVPGAVEVIDIDANPDGRHDQLRLGVACPF
jgi:Ca2+-binding RTX toxin-like protein